MFRAQAPGVVEILDSEMEPIAPASRPCPVRLSALLLGIVAAFVPLLAAASLPAPAALSVSFVHTFGTTPIRAEVPFTFADTEPVDLRFCRSHTVAW